MGSTNKVGVCYVVHFKNLVWEDNLAGRVGKVFYSYCKTLIAKLLLFCPSKVQSVYFCFLFVLFEEFKLNPDSFDGWKRDQTNSDKDSFPYDV